MNLIATEAQINTEDVIAFTTKMQRHNCFLRIMQPMANELLNQTKKRSPFPGIASNFDIKASGSTLTFRLPTRYHFSIQKSAPGLI